jgi:hypothetical protein
VSRFVTPCPVHFTPALMRGVRKERTYRSALPPTTLDTSPRPLASAEPIEVDTHAEACTIVDASTGQPDAPAPVHPHSRVAEDTGKGGNS